MTLATSDRFRLVDLGDHLSGIIDSLGYHQTIAAHDVGRRHFLVGVPQIVAGAAADFDHILEALGCDHDGARKADA